MPSRVPSARILFAKVPPESALPEKGVSDEVLLQRIAQKDALAYELFFDRYGQVVYNLIVRVIHEPTYAEELVQEIFWQVWQKADQYARIGVPAAWVLRMARNRAIDHLRYQQTRRRTLDTVDQDFLELEQSAELATESAEAIAEQGWQRQQLQHLLAAIPKEQRLCLELAYFDGLSQREIAEQTNTPLGTIKTRITIGLQKLERLLRSAGFTEKDRL